MNRPVRVANVVKYILLSTRTLIAEVILDDVS